MKKLLKLLLLISLSYSPIVGFGVNLNDAQASKFVEAAKRYSREERGFYWYTTRKFVILTNAPKKYGKQHGQLAEKTWAYYEQMMPSIKNPLKTPSVFALHVFWGGTKAKSTYKYAARGDNGGFAASNWASIHAVHDNFHEEAKIRETNGAIKHELSHIYVHNNLTQIMTPQWVDEGLAEFWASIEDHKKASYSYAFSKLGKRVLSGSPTEIYDFISCQTGWQGRNGDPLRHYTLGEAIVYYMLKGAPASGHPEYAEIIPRLWSESTDKQIKQEWKKTRKAITEKDLIRVAFGNIDIKQFVCDLQAFWADDEQTIRSKSYQPKPLIIKK